jgi:hypothetical protein
MMDRLKQDVNDISNVNAKLLGDLSSQRNLKT